MRFYLNWHWKICRAHYRNAASVCVRHDQMRIERGRVKFTRGRPVTETYLEYLHATHAVTLHWARMRIKNS